MAFPLIPIAVVVASGSIAYASRNARFISEAIDNSNKLATTVGISSVALTLTYFAGTLALKKYG